MKYLFIILFPLSLSAQTFFFNSLRPAPRELNASEVTEQFCDSAGINQSQRSALRVFTKDLGSIYYKLFAVYPFVGSDTSSFKWNLIDPASHDFAFRINNYTNGVPQWRSNGIYFPSTVYGVSNLDWYYIMAEPSIGASYVTQDTLDGIVSEGNGEFSIWHYDVSTLAFVYIAGIAPGTAAGYANGKGFWLGERRGDSVFTYRNNNVSTNQLSAAGDMSPGDKVKINYIGSFPQSHISTISYLALHKQLTHAEIQTYYSAVKKLMVNLGRE